MFKIDTITFMAALGAFQGMFFAVLLWLRKKQSTSNRIFSVLLLVTSIRIAKNIVVHGRMLNPDLPMSVEVWRFLVNFGISHQFAIGPLFMLYFLSVIQPRFQFRKVYLWHFLPYGVLTLLSWGLPWPFWRDGGLLFSYSHILFYYLWAFRLYYQGYTQLRKSLETTLTKATLKWLRSLIVICGLLMIAYFPSLFKYVGYIVGAIMYAIGVYVISVIVLRGQQEVGRPKRKYQSSNLSADKAHQLKLKLEEYMHSEQPYLDPDLTLGKLAQMLATTSHELSQVINESFGQSYAEYINGHRLQMAQNLLTDLNHRDTKIASIAYDCGFNSISSFNTLFKKHTQLTPSQYKAQHRVK
ncbi:MAG TPA: hypothetical protein DCS93_14035 [Microscillaceae bacterium]|nr:hypothetical protein [Microscillaceae bacterium]